MRPLVGVLFALIWVCCIAREIRISVPDENTEWVKGLKVEVEWAALDAQPTDTITIELKQIKKKLLVLSDRILVKTLGTRIPVEQGNFEFVLDFDVNWGDDFVVEVSFDQDKSQNSVSEKFKISRTALYFLSPGGAEIYGPNQLHTIQWQSIGTEFSGPEKVAIGIYKGDKLQYSLTNSADNSGIFQFSFPSNAIEDNLKLTIGIKHPRDSRVFHSKQISVINLNCATVDDDDKAVQFAIQVYQNLQIGKTFSYCGTWTTLGVFSNGTAHGQVLVNWETKEIIVAHRGTQPTLEDWFINAQLGAYSCDKFLPSCTDCDGCWAHTGFVKEFLEASKPLTSATLEAVQQMQNDINSIIFTGHSQGGAIATIDALNFVQKYPSLRSKVKVITFGSPRVGNKKFVELFDSAFTGGRTKRYVNVGPLSADIVTKVPALTGYVHVGGEIRIKCLGLKKRSQISDSLFLDMDHVSGNKRSAQADKFVCHFGGSYVEAVSMKRKSGNLGFFAVEDEDNVQTTSDRDPQTDSSNSGPGVVIIGLALGLICLVAIISIIVLFVSRNNSSSPTEERV